MLLLWFLCPAWRAQGSFESSERLWWEWGLILNMNSPLLPSCWGFSLALGREVSPHSHSSAYRLTGVSLTLDMGYLHTAGPAKCSRCSWPWMCSISSPPPLLTLGVGYLLGLSLLQRRTAAAHCSHSCVQQDPGTPQRLRQNCVWASPVDVPVRRGLLQGQRLWVQHTWVWCKPSCRRSPLTPP